MYSICIFLLFVHIEASTKLSKRKSLKQTDILDVPSVPPEILGIPVNFKKIRKAGVGDIDFDQPLEKPSLTRTKNDEFNELYLDEKNIKWHKENPRVFLSPRDEMLYYKKQYNPKKNVTKLKEGPNLYNFQHLLENNLARSFSRAHHPDFSTFNKVINKGNQNNTDSKFKLNNTIMSFQDNAFYIKPPSRKRNWTTCDEFAKGALFHPDDIVNTDWLPFYIWSSRKFSTAHVHRFVYPTKKVVQNYKSMYSPFITKTNWNQPKLLLKERREVLLIAGDRKGLFYGIPKQEIPQGIKGKNYTLPRLTIRLKIHDPYLAMMYCDDKYATILAELGTEPKTDSDKEDEASTLKFRGMGKPASRNLYEENIQIQLEAKRRKESNSKKFLNIEKGFSS